MVERAAEVRIADDGESGEISFLQFENRTLHRLLVEVDENSRPGVVLDALDLGAEVLSRVGHHGDLEQLSQAVERLDQEGKRIVEAAVERVDELVDQTIAGLTNSLADEDGPLAAVFGQFDPTIEGNVLDTFRDLVAASIAKSTKQAVADLAEATSRQVETLTKSVGILEKVAAVEEARLAEARKGTAKGFDHEADVESLLGELVGIAGDSLDDVSTVVGLAGNKKGDKVIKPREGCSIVTEEKCTQRISESKARQLLAAAMENRGAELGMLIVDDVSKVPGSQPYHLIDADKVVVAADRLTLRLVYTFMRAKAVERSQTARHVDDERFIEALDAIRSHIDDIGRCLERFKLVRTEHTKATKAIGQAGRYVDDVATTIADGVGDIAALIDAIVDSAEEAAA
jgi:hypothetical protein